MSFQTFSSINYGYGNVLCKTLVMKVYSRGRTKCKQNVNTSEQTAKPKDRWRVILILYIESITTTMSLKHSTI